MIATASGLERVLACPGSTRLTQIRSTSAEAEGGTSRHSFLELIANGATREAALAEVPEEHRAICEALPLDELPTDLAAEVAFGLDLADGRAWEIGRSIGREYGEVPVFAICGTADAVGVGDDAVIVIDYKGPGNRTPARRSVQLRFLALAACRAYGKERALVMRIRLGDDGAVYRDSHSYDLLDLDGFELELRERLVAAKRTEIAEGPWCQYCPAMAHCPAKALLAVQVAEGRILDEPVAHLPLTPTRAGLVYERMKAAKAFLAHLERAVMACLDEAGELPLSNGRVLRKVVGPGNESLDGDVVFAVLDELYGRGVADAAVERRATKAGIRAALKPLGGKVTQLERAALDKVRERGGASRPMRNSVEEIEA